MGILVENLSWLLNKAKPPASMLELGDQYLYVSAKPWASYPDKYLNPTGDAPVVAHLYFVELGFDHVSVDISGAHGSLPFDLTKYLDLGRSFDVVTDFGTSEHVSDLYACMQNVDRHLSPGGLLVHVNPKPGNWPGHGNWYRDMDYYRKFAAGTGYTVVDLFETYACGNSVDGWNVACMMTKGSVGWPTREIFDTFGIKRS